GWRSEYRARRMDAQLLERYADLIVSVGANVQPDQVLAVEALPEAQPLVAAIARRAYEKAARYVDVQYFDVDVKRIRAERARDGTLDWVPPSLGERIVALGDPDEALDRLWQDVVHVCRLDEPDPAAAWHERIEQIFQVARRLDALDLDALRFEG